MSTGEIGILGTLLLLLGSLTLTRPWSVDFTFTLMIEHTLIIPY